MNFTRAARPPSRSALAGALALTLVACATTADDAEAARKKPHAAPRSDDAADVVTYGRREDVMRFATELAERRGWEPEWVQAQLAQARFVPTVARLIMPPPAGTAKSWAAYRARFIEPQRVNAGVQFWNANADALARAEAQYGVPASVIVGIIGVETFYGRITGNFRVLDALATLSFDFPTGRKDRTPFFREELENFLFMCRREQRDCASFKGSYAGAMGLPQFMPSSINQHAVDFDADGHIDLLGSPADVVGSVASFLAAKGWERGLPTHYDVAPPVDSRDRALLLGPDIVPSFTAAEFAERGAVLSEAGRQHTGLLALVELQNGDAAPSYIAGTQNFYAVTRYNWSSYYALAVIELGAVVEGSRAKALSAQ
ncbi:lytic murein transglycosylase B [Ideonella sp. BN130291]|uniref:lytic murein transglycosylase B n=1 Tax=Ideonella sp. BN130291 TaxID=3112940 RepID=UPI002E25875F|nr:lytic murein transglycosylase B [Ideonella sp. BN130291]